MLLALLLLTSEVVVCEFPKDVCLDVRFQSQRVGTRWLSIRSGALALQGTPSSEAASA